MKQFLLFAGDQYYPSGGWGDFQGSFDTMQEAFDAFNPSRHEWMQVVDTASGQVVAVK